MIQCALMCCWYVPVAVATIGDVDSGKSTLIGVLSTGRLDDGRGSKRLEVFKHVHEVEHGRTSSITRQIIGKWRGSAATYNTFLKPIRIPRNVMGLTCLAMEVL